MASISNYDSGVVKQLQLPSNSSYPVELGDLVGIVSDKGVPASAFTDSGDAAANRVAFAAAFAGVALQKNGLQANEVTFHLTTDQGHFQVAESGCFRFACATGISWKPESLVGVYNDGTTNSNQKVCLVTDTDESIGRVKLGYDQLGVTTLTEVVVDILPKKAYAGLVSGS